MLKLTRFSLVLLLLAGIGLTSCIDNESTVEAILIKDKEAIEEYLAENPLEGEKEFIDEFSGVYMFWHKVSESEVKPAIGDTLSVDYVGKLLSNRVFDSSVEQIARDNDVYDANREYGPLRYRLSQQLQLIEGFESAVSLMEEGDSVTVIFPSIYGYGSAGSQGGPVPIPPNSPIIFGIELLDVKKSNN
ncbi:FKBP-type peptidyl-prolyl cis-trans isomerase [Algoriphagus hitonicola]|uniref:Peptidyl-prolyl cis-trans isomerase n=1 Tax=Algoriphagus hitonicola TaxID=435880 RepID=A0A1I2QDI8_9BACT|nr:FKBP-type peptidyl-prolyl cis-trans isomerase [Algoriphagus hitonicola]SFG26462.1 FKBP-type peptidyl-prolyl cis-trans isomerase FklB [Algoriphagus hitonicola]